MAILIYLKLSSLRRRPFCLHLFVFNQRRLSYKCDISTGGALKIDTNIESCLVFNSLQRLAPQIDGHVNLLCHKGRCYTISACLVPGKKIKLVLKSQLPTWHRRTGQDRELHQRVKALQRQDQPLASSPTCSPENEIYLAQSSSSLSHLACHLLINGRLCIKPEDWQENFWEFFKEKPDVGVRAQLDDYLQSHQHLARNTLKGYFTKKFFL